MAAKLQAPRRASEAAGGVNRLLVAAGVAAAMALAPSHAAAQRAAPSAQPAAGAFNFPPEFAKATIADVKDFEPANPGLGQAANYTLANWRITLYAYNLKRTDLAETANPVQIKPQLEQASGDIFAAQKQGTYQKVVQGQPFTVPAGQGARFHCNAFTLTSSGGVGPVRSASSEFDSYVCVTTWKKRFIKARLTAPRGATAAGDAVALMTALDKALGP
jgi:hypothetical protein